MKNASWRHFATGFTFGVVPVAFVTWLVHVFFHGPLPKSGHEDWANLGRGLLIGEALVLFTITLFVLLFIAVLARKQLRLLFLEIGLAGQIGTVIGGVISPAAEFAYAVVERRNVMLELSAEIAAAPGWIDASNGAIPPAAVEGGAEAAPGRETLFICRAAFNGGVYPGKVRLGFGSCLITVAGEAMKMPTYQVLAGVNVSWVDAPGREVPGRAYLAGAINDKKLYICRVLYNGGIHPGKLDIEEGGCSISWGGEEYISAFYDILIK